MRAFRRTCRILEEDADSQRDYHAKFGLFTLRDYHFAGRERDDHQVGLFTIRWSLPALEAPLDARIIECAAKTRGSRVEATLQPERYLFARSTHEWRQGQI